ncbi:hypothetical protein NQD34_003521 [Periophthalmus magnuspinnatus]|nr:hypothetical protein NQD34_003521 [Periophthalmus magnuspinnatus]
MNPLYMILGFYFTIVSVNQDMNINNRQIRRLLSPRSLPLVLATGFIDSVAKRPLPAKPAVQAGRGVTFSSLALDWLFGCYDTRGWSSKYGTLLQIGTYDELHLTEAECYG